MRQYETEHYLFHYPEGSLAEREIGEIAARQEACFRFICGVLRTQPDLRIEYFLCNSPEEVGHCYGDDEPCNAFARYPDQVYAVYNDKVKCVGFHEDAHLISYTIGRPDAPAVREGLAMCFDRKWWGIHNLEWTGFYLRAGRYLPIDRLLDREFFFSEPCELTYPIVGAFTEWLLFTFGLDAYLRFYRAEDAKQACMEVYGSSEGELDRRFQECVRLFRTDPILEKRMSELLTEGR